MARVSVREAPVLAACLDLFKLRGWFCWRNNTGAIRFEGRFLRFGKVGASDILAIVPRSGRLMAVEVKRPGGKATIHQESFLEAIRASGGIGVVVDDVSRLDSLLRRLEANPLLGVSMWNGREEVE